MLTPMLSGNSRLSRVASFIFYAPGTNSAKKRGRSGGLAFRFCSGEQLTRTYDVIGARAFGEQAAVADAVEAVGQHVDEEAADELIDRECHDLPLFARRLAR